LVSYFGIIGIEIDKSIAELAPSLWDAFGIIVVACSKTGCAEVPRLASDVIRTLNGQDEYAC
jgi:hypothetical protein